MVTAERHNLQADQERAKRYPNLNVPHQLAGFQVRSAAVGVACKPCPWTEARVPWVVQDVKIRFVAAGPTACHCIVGDMDGRCYTWGRNEVRWQQSAGQASFCGSADTGVCLTERPAGARRPPAAQRAHACGGPQRARHHSRWIVHRLPA